MQKQNNPLRSSRLLIYVTLAIATPVVVFYLMLLTTDPFSGAFGGPQTQTSTQRFFMYILIGVMFMSPVVAPLLGYFYFKQTNRRYLSNRKPMAKREVQDTRDARNSSRKNQLIVLGITTVGILLIWNGPAMLTAAKYYWEDMRDSLHHSAAMKKGCREINAYTIQSSSELAKGHYSIVSSFGSNTDENTVDIYTTKLNHSFNDCADGKITATDQTKFQNDYLKFLEDTSHKLLSENPLGLTQDEITKIRQLEAKNHQ